MLNVGPSISMDSTSSKMVSFGNDAMQRKQHTKYITIAYDYSVRYNTLKKYNNSYELRLNHILSVNISGKGQIHFFHA